MYIYLRNDLIATQVLDKIMSVLLTVGKDINQTNDPGFRYMYNTLNVVYSNISLIFYYI